MLIFPAIDIYEGKVVRLYKGSYDDVTVYSDDPVQIAMDFKSQGAGYMHMVDLLGARTGKSYQTDMLRRIKEATGLFIEVGGGIRNTEAALKYVEAGADRIILGTAAVENEEFVRECVLRFGDKTAVGIDVKDGFVAVKGWTETTAFSLEDFAGKMQDDGVSTIICTDISRDGAMKGTNREMYRKLSERFSMNIIASGGVSDIRDITALKEMGIYGAIIGKAYYEGTIDLSEALRVAE